jgi:hypothetical protein
LGQAGYRKALAQFNGEVSLRKFESILLDAAAGTIYPWSAAVDQDKFILTELLDAVGGVGLLEPACAPASRDHLPVYGGQYDMRLPYDREAFENSSVVDMAAAMARAIRRRGLRRLARNAFARGSEFIQHTFSGVLRRLRHPLSKRV